MPPIVGGIQKDRLNHQMSRQTVQNLVNSASNEQQRHEKQERLMQDFVTEAGFQAALLLKANASELKIATRKIQAAILQIKSNTYSRDEIHRMLKFRQAQTGFAVGEPNIIVNPDVVDFSAFANDDSNYKREQLAFAARIDRWMNETSDKLGALEDQFVNIETRINTLESVHKYASTRASTPGTAGSSSDCIQTRPPLDHALELPIETGKQVRNDLDLHKLRTIAHGTDTDSTDIVMVPVKKPPASSHITQEPDSTFVELTSVRDQVIQSHIAGGVIEPIADEQTSIRGMKTRILDQAIADLPRTSRTATSQGGESPREFSDMAQPAELRSRIDLQAQNQQKQLDQALADLETLERATQKFATKLEVERTSQNIIEQINDVDARVQSLAEQVVQLVGGEHDRLIETERNVDSMADRCKHLSEGAKLMKEQFSHYQQQFSLQLEELLDNMQRHRSVATTKHSSHHGEFNAMRCELDHLRLVCMEQGRGFKTETCLLKSELKRHQALYRDMLHEYTLLLHDSYKIARRTLDDQASGDITRAIPFTGFRQFALSLPMQIGDRRAAPGMTVLDNLRLKEENLRLKTLVQISPTT